MTLTRCTPRYKGEGGVDLPNMTTITRSTVAGATIGRMFPIVAAGVTHGIIRSLGIN